MRELKRAILRLAPNHTARDVAPASWDDLARYRGSVLPVWSGESERTIWGDARVNYAFRAWHDSTHRALGADFTLAGETAVIEAQISALYRLYPSAPGWCGRLLRIEGIGQVIEFQRTGAFPVDQVAFVTGRFGIIPQ